MEQMTAAPPRIPQRKNPGTRYEDLYQSYVTYASPDAIEAPFMYQEYLQQLIRASPADPEALVAVPPNGDPLVWQYEHLRQFCLELTGLVVALHDECSDQSCPEMKANEWQYLCAAHPTPKNCCAFDYIVHTIDGACGLLNNPKFFPSRVSMGTPAVQQFGNIARRLYRVFAHAYFHHRAVFDRYEAASHLYARFVAFILKYDLMDKDTILIKDQ
ncbi:hypothetical protein AMAG_01445 [Allomyces macrogynus ATCC 38327]|uniref:Mob1/phocein family protein n=1 Tax=Allomyces macrogynus (strain ATCC 38327) TaxID=578462 RepID=A0A0L0RZI0_ALLM3|nr:hypothetical protein AMAG_01445 [Allomyces macrogynus ATCC 38327]|eukprot:KNE55555.1 hypothetical protein AMAG_01445 [Allomyces macrogynus ATCC 38327]